LAAARLRAPGLTGGVPFNLSEETVGYWVELKVECIEGSLTAAWSLFLTLLCMASGLRAARRSAGSRCEGGEGERDRREGGVSERPAEASIRQTGIPLPLPNPARVGEVEG